MLSTTGRFDITLIPKVSTGITDGRVIIAGSREIDDEPFVFRCIEASGFQIKQVVCGCCVGVDRIGYNWARDNNVPVIFMPAWRNQFEWALEHQRPDEEVIFNDYSGKVAGFIRNRQMVNYSDALIAVHIKHSAGTRQCIGEALNKRIPIKATKYENHLLGHRRSNE